jgi:thiamine biosynthesis lipoprotein ApbE
MHHLLDPSTGLPAATDLDTVTVVGRSLWFAEVVAKVALMAGSERARSVLEGFGMTGVLVSGSGECANYEVVSNSEVAV